MADTFQPSTPRANYLVRHWRGELGLGTSYWLNSALLGTLVPVLLSGMVAAASKSSDDLRVRAAGGLLVLLFAFAAWLWGVVGVWASSHRSVARGGSAFWAGAARVMVVLGVLSMAAQIVTRFVPQMTELARLAAGRDPIQKVKVTIAPNGGSILLTGSLGTGSASEVIRVLNAAPAVKTIELNSNGGRLLEAQVIAREVRARGLNTYVQLQCDSACTYIFLAGRERASTPNARIGFHRPAFAGQDANEETASVNEMLDSYRSAGISDAFLARIRQTDSKSIWYPSRDELVTNKVVSRTSLGGETVGRFALTTREEFRKALRDASLWKSIESRFPGTIDKATSRAWAAKERGASDDEMMTAGRSVIGGLFPQLLRNAHDDQLDLFLRLMIDEMAAANAVSALACAKLLDSQLNIYDTLPRTLFEREASLMVELAKNTETTPRPRVADAIFQRVLGPVRARLTTAEIRIISGEEKANIPADRKCAANRKFYEAIAALPINDRRMALLGLFQRGS